MTYIENSSSLSDGEAFRYYPCKPEGKSEAGELSQMAVFFVETLQLNGWWQPASPSEFLNRW